MATPFEFRNLCHKEAYTQHTSGVLSGHVQANLLILPREAAKDFTNLCERNPVPCPLLAKTRESPNILDDNGKLVFKGEFDIRTNFPRYNIYENGEIVEQKLNCIDEWTNDHIGFLIGCSFSFEAALIESGLPPKNFVQGCNVSMYKTTKFLDAAGIFQKCPYVVSMRPYKPENLEEVRMITGRFKKTHGEPIDWGFDGAKRLGIKDLSKPDYGDSVAIDKDEIPVFWACGVTPQLAVSTVGEKITGKVIGHVPGHMLVLDAIDDIFQCV